MEEESYAVPVHTSLMEKSVMFGIGSTVFAVIAMVTTVLCAMVNFFCIIFGVAAVLICRLVCKKDNMTLEFMFQNLQIRDFYRG